MMEGTTVLLIMTAWLHMSLQPATRGPSHATPRMQVWLADDLAECANGSAGPITIGRFVHVVGHTYIAPLPGAAGMHVVVRVLLQLGFWVGHSERSLLKL